MTRHPDPRGRRGRAGRLCQHVTSLVLGRVAIETNGANALRFTCRSRATVAVGRKLLCALSAHLPSLGNDRGLHGVSAAPCSEWFGLLQARLRRVRVACGDWRRVPWAQRARQGQERGGAAARAPFSSTRPILMSSGIRGSTPKTTAG